jgi:hypothetical protein
MKRFTAPRSRAATLLALAALVVIGVVTVTASAATRRSAAAPSPSCSIASVAGAWGQNFDGSTNQGVVEQFAGAGRIAIDGQGNVSGTETSVPWFGGPSSVLTVTGTLSMNADCTGTLTLNLSEQSGALQRKEVWAVVYVANQTAMRGALAAMTNAGGFPVSNASATLNADKVFPPAGQ